MYNLLIFIINIIIIIIIIMIIDFVKTRNLNYCSFKNMILHNDLCTMNNYVYKEIFKINFLNKNKNKFNILEIGAGNGNSTNFFIKVLEKNNINFNYTICEIDNDYNKILTNKILECNKFNYKRCKYINYSWEKLNNKFDIILNTVFSSINENNYELFKNNLCYNDTIIFTIMTIFKFYKIKKFNFTVIFKKQISPLFFVFVLKI
jgi:16S rRNA A1518/A1519 N6-dimethyltransferase RsmA/KsgA/DIM1 with predicted DNA glycosylase/AP lyase activity